MLHWALAVSFLLLYLSALLLFLTWGEPQPRHFHQWFGRVHRGAGVCLIVFPLLALGLGKREWRSHLENVREAWVWTRDDFRWLILCPRAAVDSRIALPEQGKFNAAEKLNFMMVQASYPLYIVTGIWTWLPGVAFLPWVAHVGIAVLGLPLVLGHIFMATVNPSTRVGLTGMVTGWVDREWAKHHYRRWYRRRFEGNRPAPVPVKVQPMLDQPATVRCRSCGQVAAFGTWKQLMRRVFQVEPIFCPACDEEILVVSAELDPAVLEAVLEHLDSGRSQEPFHEPVPCPVR